MRKNIDNIDLEEATAFLKDKLNAHSDSISIEQFDYLFRIDKNKIIISSALEYASDANVNPDNIAEIDALIDFVGNKIDALQADYDKYLSCYIPNKKKQMEYMLRDLQIVHFGLIATLLVKKI